MNKQEAKRRICKFLATHLDPAIIAEFVNVESSENSADRTRLWNAVEELEAELTRRSETSEDREYADLKARGEDYGAEALERRADKWWSTQG